MIGVVLSAVITFCGGTLFLLHPTPWNFPGDPPLFDVLLYPAGMATVVNAPVWLITKRWWDRTSAVRTVSRTSVSVSLALFVVAAAGIAERHDARWSAIRTGIRQYGDEIAAAAGDPNKVLSHDEFVELKGRFLPTPVPVHLPGYGTVTLRMAHGIYPYVGVDFGGGANALFDPRTMRCTYSD